MNQQQAVQPIVLKQENGELVLKIVLENPKQETQTLILQQPDGKEFSMSTDKTAIASFDSAMWIAIVLALCATGLAYWFGVRSFDLTTKAFNLTLNQIGNETQKTLTSNKELYQSQEKLKIQELRFIKKSETIDRLSKHFEEYIGIAEKIAHVYRLNSKFLKNSNENIFKINTYEFSLHNELLNQTEKLNICVGKIKLYLNPIIESHGFLYVRLDILVPELNQMISGNYQFEKVDEISKLYKGKLEIVIRCFYRLIELEVANNKGEEPLP